MNHLSLRSTSPDSAQRQVEIDAEGYRHDMYELQSLYWPIPTEAELDELARLDIARRQTGHTPHEL